MGKRSNFERVERDYYPTPLEGVQPLFKYLPAKVKFSEPMSGNGQLVNHLVMAGHECVQYSDIEPMEVFIDQLDVFDERLAQFIEDSGAEIIITNPPWDRDILHAVIEKLRKIKPTWLLFDADWKETVQAIPYLPYCHLIVPVGRLKWVPNSPSTGKDNCSWHLFKAEPSPHGGPICLPRQAKSKKGKSK